MFIFWILIWIWIFWFFWSWPGDVYAELFCVFYHQATEPEEWVGWEPVKQQQVQ